MASFKPNLNREKVVALGFMILSLSLGSSPSLAQLPELPPAPPAPPASSPESPSSYPDPPPATTEQSSSDSPYLRPQAACPDDLGTLSALLIRDIPSYTNRIIQSSVADIPTAYRPSYVITASFPERMPLEIRDRVYTTDADSGDLLEQVFFTTLERQYSGLEATSLSHFHWLFLAPSDQGWEMVFMFSAVEADGVQVPPRDSSGGSVGQAVRTWLRDCQANAVFAE